MQSLRWRIGKFLNKIAARLQLDRPGAHMQRFEIAEQFVEYETNNTYEAAYYMAHGAEIQKVAFRPVPENKRDKTGYSLKWIITLSGVSSRGIKAYREDKAQISVVELEKQRRKLKKIVKNFYMSPYGRRS